MIHFVRIRNCYLNTGLGSLNFMSSLIKAKDWLCEIFLQPKLNHPKSLVFIKDIKWPSTFAFHHKSLYKSDLASKIWLKIRSPPIEDKALFMIAPIFHSFFTITKQGCPLQGFQEGQKLMFEEVRSIKIRESLIGCLLRLA